MNKEPFLSPSVPQSLASLRVSESFIGFAEVKMSLVFIGCLVDCYKDWSLRAELDALLVVGDDGRIQYRGKATELSHIKEKYIQILNVIMFKSNHSLWYVL